MSDDIQQVDAPISPSLLKPVAVAVLSLVFAGLGHLFLRQYVRGIVFLVICGFAYMISDYWPPAMLFNVILFIFSAVDAFSFGRRGFGIF